MELTITLPERVDPVAVLGSSERNLKIMREVLGVNMNARGNAVRISGEGANVDRAARLLGTLTEAAQKRKPMSREQVIDAVHNLHEQAEIAGGNDHSTGFGITAFDQRGGASQITDVGGRSVRPKTEGQTQYLQAIAKHDMTFCIGPAGTGKTYLAVAAAVQMLRSGQVRKLVLVRPAVEAGERLGFLPGDMQQKVNPYLRPLLDALHDMMSFDQVQKQMAVDVIEIVPLAFMRGRTLNDAMIILDEAQNTTVSQMMMFLTRLGHGSKMVITGDVSQTDLPPETVSGLVDAARRLRRVAGIAFTQLGRDDIVRHNLVQRIVEQYGQNEKTDTQNI